MARVESLHHQPDVADPGGPGYRRRIRLVPGVASVLALLEDDIHSMAVRLRHDGAHVLAVEPLLDRMPWTTCPGAAAVLVKTFAGLPLSQVTLRSERKANCTHLHDLAVLAAAHARDAAQTCFDIAVSDPVDGRRELTLRQDGVLRLHWIEDDGVLVDPPELSGRALHGLRDAIAGLPIESRETARLLQWAGLVAHGRTLPMDRQNDARRMPANCYTFQPEQALSAVRVGHVIDFSTEERQPGESFGRTLGLASLIA